MRIYLVDRTITSIKIEHEKIISEFELKNPNHIDEHMSHLISYHGKVESERSEIFRNQKEFDEFLDAQLENESADFMALINSDFSKINVDFEKNNILFFFEKGLFPISDLAYTEDDIVLNDAEQLTLTFKRYRSELIAGTSNASVRSHLRFYQVAKNIKEVNVMSAGGDLVFDMQDKAE